METLEPRKWASPSSPQVHKAHLPSGESPYAQAKRLLDKNPNKAISLFWAAINNRDRIDSALKDMAMVMKQVSRPEEAIEAIRSFRYLCSVEAQDSLDNVLLDLYKIELLSLKLKLMDEGLCLGGRLVKMGRFPAKKFYVSEDQEKARLLGNLAWAYMQSENYNEAELIYRYVR
ncbi:putative tetratricopeptide-like helical domain superfamily [Dioscorea sansibarensis]